uniref:ABC transporter ATP-binding protein n=1 Tax=uncultured Leeuwenhoekiella sp. TaxID=487010 RepID=F4MLN3_9FLAO|nr:ABC transporter ATP-binding protein [uncultured Leeuwenhoekiella sp.]
MALLQVINLHKSYGERKLLNSCSFKLQTGEIIGVFGRNGAGKSTLLKILFGTTTAQEGCIKFNESRFPVRRTCWDKNTIISKGLIGYLPQFSFLPKAVRVWDIIPHYFNGEEQNLIFTAPRMADIAKRKVNELSLGQRRYLEVLILGNLKHPFLLLDEPFSMVEPLFKELIHEFLFSLKEKKGILITDHYYQDVWKLSDRKLILNTGKLIPIENKSDLVKHNYILGDL